jgi:hypothetical protein
MDEEKKSMAEKDYAHRDVVDKLSIKPGHVVAFDCEAGKIDDALHQRILERAGRAPAAEDEVVDVVLAFVDNTTDVIEVLQRWRTRLKPTGGIWLLTARRGQPGYVDQRELIAAGLQAGVVDNKVCSISPMISAMRFVIRKKDR